MGGAFGQGKSSTYKQGDASDCLNPGAFNLSFVSSIRSAAGEAIPDKRPARSFPENRLAVKRKRSGVEIRLPENKSSINPEREARESRRY